jgi:hypothetical protein
MVEVPSTPSSERYPGRPPEGRVVVIPPHARGVRDHRAARATRMSHSETMIRVLVCVFVVAG